MGLEALVESYAFWRPSLRTLTFEDIPGMTKQGKVQKQDVMVKINHPVYICLSLVIPIDGIKVFLTDFHNLHADD